MTTAFFIGRFAPAHIGHIDAIMKALNEYDKVIVGLGSCYDVGTKRAPLLAVYREKILLLSIKNAGGDLSKLKIVHIQDYESFDEWLDDVLLICKKYKVTHFITGNNEDILDIIKQKKLDLPYTFINPEINSFTKFHASELRKAIVEGDFKKYENLASSGAKILLPSFDGFNKIRTSFVDNGRTFNAGKQSCDLVFTLQERIVTPSGKPFLKTYVLVGNRPADNPDFPKYLGIVGTTINKFESPINAVIRALKTKAGINCKLLSNTSEPATVLLESDVGKVVSELGFLQFYNDKLLAGMGGGSSQCFYINIYASPKIFNNVLKKSRFKFVPVYECLEEPMAYQHKDMVKDAVNRLSHYAE